MACFPSTFFGREPAPACLHSPALWCAALGPPLHFLGLPPSGLRPLLGLPPPLLPLFLVDDHESVGALLGLGVLEGTRLDASRQSLADTEAKHFAT